VIPKHGKIKDRIINNITFTLAIVVVIVVYLLAMVLFAK